MKQTFAFTVVAALVGMLAFSVDGVAARPPGVGGGGGGGGGKPPAARSGWRSFSRTRTSMIYRAC
jgi:hypothetical protein